MPNFWLNKRVFVTGHTGFKGGWLTLWLHMLGARIYGYALPPDTRPSLFTVADIEPLLSGHTLADIRDSDKLKAAMAEAKPDIVLHLAAQPLVRRSYQDPVETYMTNVMGTVNLLEAIRQTPNIKAVVNVTTDKCYDNKEWLWPYREGEPLGGHDPYSSSKACSELVTASYRKSFLSALGVGLASARAGNVIGGGDWSDDRLIPDFLRAMDAGQMLKIRSPRAVRPWQHVLEPLKGYLMLAEALYGSPEQFDTSWNFGPGESDSREVTWIVETLATHLPDLHWEIDSQAHPHEAGLLRLDSSKARQLLHWQPRWDLQTALQKIAEWHLGWKTGQNMQTFCRSQIHAYEQTILK
ncbi:MULTISPECIES: CDP-glucose 4,6-dehydratase [unclassified Methylophilus]|uniref:CDP-glucose 4,6-dehydratase n=1 Tax=unclassified Methylophilus TaxID=2630143 RepID=UPI00036AFF75|nr:MULTISPECIES: CDP-glucose 4,6-dehydratase [unclassified Methylophilus]